METKYLGKVDKWFDEKGFGFIYIPKEKSTIFCHISNVRTNKEKLEIGMHVSFVKAKSEKGFQAKNVEILSFMKETTVFPEDVIIEITESDTEITYD